MRKLLIGLLALVIASATSTAHADTGTVDPLLLAPTYIDNSYATTATAGTGTTTGFSYTVPAGRIFRLQRAAVFITNGVTAGASSNLYAPSGVSGGPMLAVNSTANAGVDAYNHDAITGAIDFPAGAVITAAYVNAGSASVTVTGEMHGVEFNAP